MERRTLESAARITRGTEHPDESWGKGKERAPPELVTGRAWGPEPLREGSTVTINR